jgi:ATP-dependent DNA ligase
MLAWPVEALPGAGFLTGGCLYEPKWDGYRVVVHAGRDGVRLQSRRGADYSAAFREIVAGAAVQLPVGTVLDGELVVWDTAGERLDFAAVHQRAISRIYSGRW